MSNLPNKGRYPKDTFWEKFTSKEAIIDTIKGNFHGFCHIATLMGLLYEDGYKKFRDTSTGALYSIDEIAEMFLRFNGVVKSMEKNYFDGPYLTTSLN
jgi:hypothetical protein